ncbi:MAG: type III-B CRISPR module RAMP protein Cmr1 [Sulfuricella sp.]
MKLRKPEGDAPKVSKAVVYQKSFEVELITPLYGGGVRVGEPDSAIPIRAAAIRGQLRFWWRLLHRNTYPNSRDLFLAERAIFGGLGNDGAATASRLLLWVTDVKASPPVRSVRCAAYSEDKKSGMLKGPNWQEGLKPVAYVMFPGQGQLNKSRNGYEKKPADILLPGLRFNLHLSVGGDLNSADLLWQQQIKPALRWWASFGGLGARTRRGVGAVKVASLPPVESMEVEGYGCRLVPRSPIDDPKKAWINAIEKLKNFRQGVGPSEKRNPGPGRSRWPEADSIREITGCHLVQPTKSHAPTHPARQSFPRAAFGLPIITHFKDAPNSRTSVADRPKCDPEDTVLYPVVNGDKRDRLASPLILKPMWNGNDYTPIALLLPYDHVSRMGLSLENNTGANNPNLSMPFAVNDWWTLSLRTAMTGADANKPNPLRGKTGDVLADFLTYFESQPRPTISLPFRSARYRDSSLPPAVPEICGSAPMFFPR